MGHEDAMRKEIDSFGALQKRVEDQARLGLECLRLAKFAPLETRERVERLLASKSKYLDLRALSRQLARRDYAQELDPKDFIDRERLLRDIHEGSALKEFMAKYQEASLDVVSLAEIRSLIDAARPSEAFGSDLIAQIKAVLEHVDDQMRYVSHDRRSQISLGEFMTRHHYLNASSFQHYSSDLLRSQIESTLGRAETQAEAAAAVDWELAGVRSPPQSPFAESSGPEESKRLQAQIREASRGEQPRGAD